MPTHKKEPTLLGFVGDLLLFVFLGTLSFSPVIAIFVALGLVWEICTH